MLNRQFQFEASNSPTPCGSATCATHDTVTHTHKFIRMYVHLFVNININSPFNKGECDLAPLGSVQGFGKINRTCNKMQFCSAPWERELPPAAPRRGHFIRKKLTHTHRKTHTQAHTYRHTQAHTLTHMWDFAWSQLESVLRALHLPFSSLSFNSCALKGLQGGEVRGGGCRACKKSTVTI